MTVAVTRRELSAAGLRREAVCCRDVVAARRMLALALVLEGSSREAAARAAGMDRQTLRDWVHRYNQEGIAGLRDRPRSGRKPRLTPAQGEELAAVVEQGPEPDRDRLARRCRTGGPCQPHPAAAAAQEPGAQPGRERLGVSAPEPAQPAGLA